MVICYLTTEIQYTHSAIFWGPSRISATMLNDVSKQALIKYEICSLKTIQIIWEDKIHKLYNKIESHSRRYMDKNIINAKYWFVGKNDERGGVLRPWKSNQVGYEDGFTKIVQ